MLWRAISEELPGPKWAGLFAEYWPFYRKWWLKEGEPARPTYAPANARWSIAGPEPSGIRSWTRSRKGRATS